MTQPNHHEQLTHFGEAQLAALSVRDICASTVHLILTTSFFTGAAIGLAKSLKTDKKKYLSSLRSFLETHFGLSSENASGMIESNARLYKRYALIDTIYAAGVESAIAWHKNPATNDTALKTLLEKYQDLSMSELNIEGIKEQKVIPVEVETIIEVEAAPVPIEKSPRWGLWVFWLLVVLLLGLAGFGVIFPEYIPTQLLENLPPELHNRLSPSFEKN